MKQLTTQRRAVIGTIIQHLSEWAENVWGSQDFDWHRWSQEVRKMVDKASCIVWAEFMTDTSLHMNLDSNTIKLFNLIATF